MRGDTDKHRQQGDFISLHLYFKNNEIRTKEKKNSVCVCVSLSLLPNLQEQFKCEEYHLYDVTPFSPPEVYSDFSKERTVAIFQGRGVSQASCKKLHIHAVKRQIQF
jgi:hypothetical protein